MTEYRALLFAASLCTGVLLSVSGAGAQTIYDSDLSQQLDLDRAQRAKVRSIASSSHAELMAVMKANGIDPNAPPEMKKLAKASGPLRAVARREREQLAEILNPAQLKQYDQIVAQTDARVRNALH